jgi:putative peptide maturation system protein
VSVDAAAAEAVALLRRVRGLAATEAEAQLRELRQRLPALTLDLLPERNAYNGAREYGVLVRAEEETAYVTCRGRESTPWLLHQVHDFRESILLFVDAEALSVGEVVAALDEWLEHASLCSRLIDTCIINRELKKRAYVVSDEELQAEVNAMRRRRGLLTAADTERWLRAHGVSHQQLEKMAATGVKVRRLREELCAPSVESHFHAHREALGRAMLVRLRCANVVEARRARARVTSRESFFALSDELLRDDLRQGATAPRLDTRVVTRHDLEPSLAAEVFARAGAIAGPEVTPDGTFLLYVSSIAPAETLDPELRQVIERQLFAAWLQAQREHATVEWNWGRDG